MLSRSFRHTTDDTTFFRCRERIKTMTSASDITLMLTSDGLEWGKYISDRLKGFPRITCDSLVLDDQEYENPPEVALACCQSTVVLLLATPQMLVYLQDKAGWFSRCLENAPATSALAVILLLDRQDIDDVTKDSYVTSEWTYFDPGHDVKDVQQMLAQVLDVVDRCRLAKEKAERAKTEEVWQSPPPPTLPKPANTLVGLFPSTIYEVRGCCLASLL